MKVFFFFDINYDVMNGVDHKLPKQRNLCNYVYCYKRGMLCRLLL